MRNQKSIIALVALFTMLVATPATADPREDYKKMAGYVDFSKLGLSDKVEANVEVLLRGPLLDICRITLENEEPGLASALDDIHLISVNVFPLDDVDTKGLSNSAKTFTSELEKKGWEMAIRVRERDENVYIYMLPGKNDEIEGLVVIAIEDDDEATLVNIVGKIDPEKIGRLGHSININGIDLHHLNDYDRKKKKDRK